MKRVFADNFFWVARAVPSDQWHEAARRAHADLGRVHLVTPEEVLTEFLTSLSGRGSYWRQRAVTTVILLRTDPALTIVSQTPVSFQRGLELYANRLDKEYSLVDCISMNAMHEEGITEILTNDHHFTQEGFRVLVPRP